MGELTGPNPTGLGKPGSKCHLLTDRRGLPLAVGLSAAHTHDAKLLEAMVNAVAPVKRPAVAPVDPGKRPASLRIERLGRHRYVVERSLAWLVSYRRLQVRHERHADMLLGFLHLACSLICLNSLNRPRV